MIGFAAPLRPADVAVALLAGQRLAELSLARRNEAAARARGAVEVGAAHYPVIVAMHAGWLVATWQEGRRSETIRRGPLAATVMAQLLRRWAIATLGPQWTTRVLVDPTARPVTSGPYRWMAHPNYLAVAVEIAAVPLALGARRSARWFSLLDAVVLWRRISVESRARRAMASRSPDDARPMSTPLAYDRTAWTPLRDGCGRSPGIRRPRR